MLACCRKRPFLIRPLENTLIKLLKSLDFYDELGRDKIAIGEQRHAPPVHAGHALQSLAPSFNLILADIANGVYWQNFGPSRPAWRYAGGSDMLKREDHALQWVQHRWLQGLEPSHTSTLHWHTLAEA